MYSVNQLLCAVIETVKANGGEYKTAKQDERNNTAAIAWDAIRTTPGYGDTAENRKVAEKVVRFVKERKADGEFAEKLRDEINGDEVTFKNKGIVAYAYLAWRIATAPRPKASPDFIGTPGKRVTFSGKLERKAKIGGGGRSFDLYIHIFRLKGGEKAVWFSGNSEFDEGKGYKVRATVKKHETRDDSRDTIVTRVRPAA